jgi:kumamolisin
MTSKNPYTKFVHLAGSDHLPLSGSRLAGPIDLSEPASVVVRTASKASADELTSTISEIYSKPVSSRTYLTHDEVEANFGSTKGDQDAVEDFAQHFHLTVVSRSTAERSVVLRGALGDLVRAFKADLAVYDHAVGTYRGRTGPISVPDSLREKIVGVFGLDTSPKRRLGRRTGNVFQNATAADTTQGQTGANFASHYQFPTQANGVQLDGTGQTVALIELGGGYENSDLTAFFQGNPPSVTAVAVDNTTTTPTGNLPTGDPNGPDGEVGLDIEVFGSAAPKARIAVYFGPNTSAGFIDTISAAVHDTQRNPSVISISWGEPDDFVDPQSITAFSQIFQTAAALGITVCAASGDHGSADMDWQTWSQNPQAQGYHVNHPASDPGVLGVGGTQINPDNTEVVWNDGTALSSGNNGGWASGGGVSPTFTTVPTWQQNAGVPVSKGTGNPGRGVPDVAASATNYATVVDNSGGVSGGTSAATPLWAALIVLLNQANGKNVGFINPFLYANAGKGLTTPITSGTNAISGTLDGYSAGPGWSACTGLGIPVGTAILAALTSP